MKSATALVLLAVLFGAPWGLAVEHHYAIAKLLDVQHKTREKVDLYLVNTPVTTAVPYFEIVVRCDNNDYTAEYTPRHPEEELPEGWVAGTDVNVRAEKHRLFIQRPDGSEIQWTVLKRRPSPKEQ